MYIILYSTENYIFNTCPDIYNRLFITMTYIYTYIYIHIYIYIYIYVYIYILGLGTLTR